MTINDIAKEAGVSRSTVSRVINKDTFVSKEKAQKVREVIKKYDFIPNKAASNTKKKIKTFLILVTRLDSYSENRVIRGIIESASDDIEFIIAETRFDIELTKKLIDNNKIISGLIIFAISGEKYEFLNDALIPVVFIGQEIKGMHNNLYFPDYKSMYELISKYKTNKDYPIFLGLDEKDNTKLQRYKVCQKLYDEKIPFVHIKGYNFRELDYGQLNLHKYNTFICATESIALLLYIHLLKIKKTDYKIFSAGYNKNNSYMLEKFYTVDYHYKEAGKKIINSLLKKEKFIIEQKYSLTIIK